MNARKLNDLKLVGIIRCECGNPSTMMKAGRQYICQRCDKLEGLSFAQELRQRRTLGDSKTKWTETPFMRRLAALPQWLRDWSQNECNQSSDIMLNRIECWIDDLPGELVVHGHGEYHLAL